MTKLEPPIYPPMLMDLKKAVEYVGFPEDEFLSWRVPKKVLGRQRLYHRLDLDMCLRELEHGLDPADAFPRYEAPKPIGRRECAVYRYFDAQGSLLYVGIAYDFGARHIEHQKCKWWHPLIQKALVRIYASRMIAEAIEANAIDQEGPAHNVTRPGPHPLPSHILAQEDPQGCGTLRVLDEITHEYETGPAISPRESLMASMVDRDD